MTTLSEIAPIRFVTKKPEIAVPTSTSYDLVDIEYAKPVTEGDPTLPDHLYGILDRENQQLVIDFASLVEHIKGEIVRSDLETWHLRGGHTGVYLENITKEKLLDGAGVFPSFDENEHDVRRELMEGYTYEELREELANRQLNILPDDEVMARRSQQLKDDRTDLINHKFDAEMVRKLVYFSKHPNLARRITLLAEDSSVDASRGWLEGFEAYLQDFDAEAAKLSIAAPSMIASRPILEIMDGDGNLLYSTQPQEAHV